MCLDNGLALVGRRGGQQALSFRSARSGCKGLDCWSGAWRLPSAGRPVRPGEAGVWRRSGHVTRTPSDGHGDNQGRDTFVTHNLDNHPELTRDGERHNP